MVEGVTERSYRWGRVQGWVALVLGVVFFLIALPIHSEYNKAVLYVGGAFSAVTGIGLLRKTRYGFVLVYVVAAHTALVALMATGIASLGDVLLKWSLFCWWGVPAVWYYPKRYREFGFKRGRKSQTRSESEKPGAAGATQAAVVSSGGEDGGVRKVGEEEWREAVAWYRVKVMESEKKEPKR